MKEVNDAEWQFSSFGTPIIYKGRYDMETADLCLEDGFKPHSIAKVLVDEKPIIISKADIQQWIDENRIDIQEVEKADIEDDRYISRKMQKICSKWITRSTELMKMGMNH